MSMVTVVDTETTGANPEEDHPVEIAVVEVDTETGELVGWDHCLVHAPVPIQLEAMAAHHITQEMVDMDGVEPESAKRGMMLAPGHGPFAAHNAEFDRGILRMGDKMEWVCTWRCANHLWSGAPRYSNQVLRYWLGIDVSDMPVEAGHLPHRALFDTWVTAKILVRMLQEVDLDELLTLSHEPLVLEKITFGKHYGEPWSTVPSDYLRWILGQDFDSDTMHTAWWWLSYRGYNIEHPDA